MASDTGLGALLEAARVRNGTTLNALSKSTGIPLTTLHRLFNNQVARPSPIHLVAVADTLATAREPLLAAAGYPGPKARRAVAVVPDVEAALRAAYAVPDEAIAQMLAAIDQVAAQCSGTTKTGEAK
jgi:hypothetical protein